jgi:hypothetical protein
MLSHIVGRVRLHARLFAAVLESAPISSGTFAVGGRRLAVRCAGAAHWEELQRAFIPSVAGDEDLALDLWDVDETGVPMPDPGWLETIELRHGSHGEALGAAPDGSVYRYAGPAFDIWLDRSQGHAVGGVSSRLLSPWHRLRPWQALLVPALAGTGMETVHAAMVSRDGRGVLLPGPNGSGKSTVACACLAAGLGVLGDEAICVEVAEAGVWRGHAVHAVLKLSASGLARFPEVMRRAERYDDPVTDERYLAIAGAPGSAEIGAIAFPRLGERDETRVEPIGSARAAAELLRAALSVETSRLDATFERLTSLADQTPSFALEVGRDPMGITPAVADLLDF